MCDREPEGSGCRPAVDVFLIGRWTCLQLIYAQMKSNWLQVSNRSIEVCAEGGGMDTDGQIGKEVWRSQNRGNNEAERRTRLGRGGRQQGMLNGETRGDIQPEVMRSIYEGYNCVIGLEQKWKKLKIKS